MVKFDTPKGTRDAIIKYIKYAITALFLVILHIVFLRFISVQNITPDLLLIFCVWFTLAEGRLKGLFAGFLVGIMFDIISADVIGTNALAKTVAVYIAGLFCREGSLEHKIGRYRFLYIVFLASFFHNIVYFFFYIKPSEIDYLAFVMKYGIAISSYTTVIAIFTMLFRLRKKIDID